MRPRRQESGQGTLAVTETSHGVRFLVHASPGARVSGIKGLHGDALAMRVAAAPRDGAANDELIRTLAGDLSLHARNISILTGHQSRDKLIEITGISAAQLRDRLGAAGLG